MTIQNSLPEALPTDPYFLTNAEIEEMHVPDADWNVFFEATFVDPAERGE